MKILKLTLLAVAFHLGLSSPGWALQLSDIRTAIRVRTRDTTTDTSYQRFTDARLNTLINEAQRDFINRTWLLSGTTTFGMTVGVREYAMPTDFLVPLRVTISNRYIEEKSYENLDQDRTDWTVTRSTPTSYYINNFSSNTQVYMGFYPTPSTTTVNSVTVFYAKTASDLSADTDIPFGSKLAFYQYHDALVNYVSAHCWLVQGRTDLAKPFLDLYAIMVERAGANSNKMPNYRPAARGDRGPQAP